MNEQERKRLEQVNAQLNVMAEELYNAWRELHNSTNDNGIERCDAKLSIELARGNLLNAECALRSAIGRLS